MTDPPAQNVVGPEVVTAGVASVVTLTLVLALFAQPEAYVTATLYVPAAETVVDCVVAPLDHE